MMFAFVIAPPPEKKKDITECLDPASDCQYDVYIRKGEHPDPEQFDNKTDFHFHLPLSDEEVIRLVAIDDPEVVYNSSFL